jgi:hypothetical protein
LPCFVNRSFTYSYPDIYIFIPSLHSPFALFGTRITLYKIAHSHLLLLPPVICGIEKMYLLYIFLPEFHTLMAPLF